MREFSTLDKAMELAKKGYAVYPLIKNTKTPPKGHHGYLEATRDQNTIMDWFQSNPDYNLGLRLDTSRLLVVDVDMHDPTKNGKDSLMKLQRQGKSLSPDTYIEKTASGGLHYFFKYTGDKVRQVDNWPGIDLLSDFTVIAPSEIDGKQYKPLDGRTLADIKPAPQWLVDKLAGQNVNWTSEHAYTTRLKKYTGRLIDELVSGTSSGNRNVWLTKVTGQLFASGADPENVYRLVQMVNDNFVDYPLPENEVTKIYNSILKKEVKRIGRSTVGN